MGRPNKSLSHAIWTGAWSNFPAKALIFSLSATFAASASSVGHPSNGPASPKLSLKAAPAKLSTPFP